MVAKTASNEVKPVVYKSKISIALAGYAGLLLTTLIVLFLTNCILGMAVFMFLLLCFIAHMLYTTTYTITGNELHIRCGFLYNMKLDISSIRKIQETNNPISSPAASLDRLAVTYNKRDMVLIPPANKMGFILHLLTLNPDITLQLKEQQKN